MTLAAAATGTATATLAGTATAAVTATATVTVAVTATAAATATATATVAVAVTVTVAGDRDRIADRARAWRISRASLRLSRELRLDGALSSWGPMPVAQCVSWGRSFGLGWGSRRA